MRNTIKFLTILISLSKIQIFFVYPRRLYSYKERRENLFLHIFSTTTEAMVLAEAGDGEHSMRNRKRSRTAVFNSNLHLHYLQLSTKLHLGFHPLPPDSNLVNHFFNAFFCLTQDRKIFKYD